MDEKTLQAMTFDQAKAEYRAVLDRADTNELRWMCRHDRFFLLTCVLGRDDALHPWLYARCREVEREPEGFLDLWSRFHYKSTIITLAGSVQEILRDPNITIGILSSVRPLAEKFVGQIQAELEKPGLYQLFPDILHERPPQRNWSKQSGLVVKRTANPKEPTVQAGGLVEGQPVGAHYSLRVYDDVVTHETVTSPEMIQKTTTAWELSLALGTAEGGRAWYCGTRYHPDDTYSVILKRKALKERRRICYGQDGKSVLMPEAKLATLRTEMGEKTFSSQMLQNPIAAGSRLFKDEWFQSLEKMPARGSLNVFLIIDSANAKKKTSDYTDMKVIGLGRDLNYYLLDAVRDRMNLAERTRCLFDLVERWRPNLTFWEQVGLASDVQHVKIEQENIGWHFPIAELSQSVSKSDRIGWLAPLYEAGRIWVPNRIMKTSVLGEVYDYIQVFRDHEYSTYPVCGHDDMLDNLANIMHPTFVSSARFPVAPRQDEGRSEPARTNSAWKPF
jgi:predicted phage terminase large subunit-like protein